MAHARYDVCGCFPTGVPYPGIAELLLLAPPSQLGMADEIAADTPWRDIPLAVIDTETTGRDPSRGDRVVEIAIVHFDRGEVTARHSMLVNPGVPIPAEASAVHHITDDKVMSEPRFDALVSKILPLLVGRIPLAYNSGFDRSFIFAEMRRAGRPPVKNSSVPPAMRITTDWIDPLVWARALQSSYKGFKLGEVAARAGVDLVNAHRATDDAEAAGRVFYALLAQQPAMTYRTLISQQRGLIAGGSSRAAWRR